ncbi:hypothetical protein, partial [Listeria kieliensis]
MKKWLDVLIGCIGLFAIGVFILSFSHVFAEKDQSDSLLISSNVGKVAVNSPFEITIQDKTNSLEKVYVPITEGLAYQELKQGNATITNDSVNHQLIIEWKKNQEHKVVLGFTSSKPKTVSLQAVDDANNTSNSVSIVV